MEITVGDPARARTIAKYLDKHGALRSNRGVRGNMGTMVNPMTGEANPPDSGLFALHSERGFLTMTGTYKGVPVSIVSIGMGFPNMDFFVRECRELLEGEMIVIR
jgi:uridine phosphorylase